MWLSERRVKSEHSPELSAEELAHYAEASRMSMDKVHEESKLLSFLVLSSSFFTKKGTKRCLFLTSLTSLTSIFCVLPDATTKIIIFRNILL